MKHIYVNLKRFDIPDCYGGVNSIAPIKNWASYIIENTQAKLEKYTGNAEFTMFFPELHLIQAIERCKTSPWLQIGCQSVFWKDTTIGGAFGAFTGSRSAHAMQAAGCQTVIVGHCEERGKLSEIMQMAGCLKPHVINDILNQKIRRATEADLKVLYCIGETADERDNWANVLKEQICVGLDGIKKDHVVIAYEPVWAIGPGKTPPNREDIKKVGTYIKEITNGIDVVYGGGLKTDNAAMLASVPEIDGGLIALTRFSGEIGFYPDEYLEIVRTYLEAC